MSNSIPHVIILGAGPSGLGAAYRLALKKIAKVTVLEQSDRVGGNAGSFVVDGLSLDYGSHRLHSSCDPRILGDLKTLLGGDLLLRPRHGRIRIRNRWIHFPLKPINLLLKIQPSFTFGVLGDVIRKMAGGLLSSEFKEDTFASVLQSQLGSTVCREFYFPYAEKIWGLAPDMISGVQAKRRVSANSVGKMINKALSGIYRKGLNSKNYFYYPRSGYGQISDAIYNASVSLGADFKFNSRVKQVHTANGTVRAVTYENNSGDETVDADYVWSTIPITVLIRSLLPKAPGEILHSASGIRYRAMILVYLILETDRFSEYDAHYFPGSDIAITRLSEPKNYSDTDEPTGLTALCAELPCDVNDRYWQMNEDQLAAVVINSLQIAKIPITSRIRNVIVRRISHAYPIYEIGYGEFFESMDRYIEGIGNLLTFGRQGLFAHDNTHHALYMAYAAVDCLDEQGRFNSDKWLGYRRIFETHVVED